MRFLSARDLLEIWDMGSGRDHTGRALLMLEYSGIAQTGVDIAGLSIGSRDGLLLDLREQIFGSRIEALDRCPACGTVLEVIFDIADIRAGLPQTVANRLNLTFDGYELAVRLPTSRDLAAIRTSRDVAEARDALLERSVIEVNGVERPMAAKELPEAICDQINAALGEADPLAEVELELACAECAYGWSACFDIVGYLWAEIEQFGRRTLRDVHVLARTYGWSEDAVLSLSAQRRQMYLEMISDG